MLVISSLFACLLTLPLISAHPGEHHEVLSEAQLAKRSFDKTRRSALMSRCGSQIDLQRRSSRTSKLARRQMRRSAALDQQPVNNDKHQAMAKRDIPTSVLSAAPPYYTSLQNTSCTLDPEVTEGPYYVNDVFVRQDLRETQQGVQLLLDVGLIDINTCQPLDNYYVEIWNANATGHYSGFEDNTGGSGSTGGGGMGGNTSMSAGGSAMPSFSGTGSMVAPSGSMSAAGAAPSGNSTSGGSGGGMGSSMSNQDTFLRGGWPSNSQGMVEFNTIFPGFYSGRTVHTHVMVSSNYSIADDGTLHSREGTIHHIGQIFWPEDVLEAVMNTTVYLENPTTTRTLNSEDSILSQEAESGNNPYAQSVLLGSSIEDGLVSYVTIGIDTSFTGSITSTNTLTSINAAIESSVLAAMSSSKPAAADAIATTSSGSSSSGSKTSTSTKSSTSSQATATAAGQDSSTAATTTNASYKNEAVFGTLLVALFNAVLQLKDSSRFSYELQRAP